MYEVWRPFAPRVQGKASCLLSLEKIHPRKNPPSLTKLYHPLLPFADNNASGKVWSRPITSIGRDLPRSLAWLSHCHEPPCIYICTSHHRLNKSHMHINLHFACKELKITLKTLFLFFISLCKASFGFPDALILAKKIDIT